MTSILSMQRRKIIVYEDELEKLKIDIDNLKRNRPEESKAIIERKLVYKEYDFNAIEKVVYEYIKNNPGTTQQRVIDNISRSRNTIHKAIHRLEKGQVIVIREDEHNSRIHHLFINNEHLLISLMEEVDSFRRNYFTLIDEVILRCGRENSGLGSAVGSGLLLLYRQFVFRYTVGDLFDRNEHAIDKETLHKQFTVIFKAIQEMRTKLSETLLSKTGFDVNEVIKSELITSLLLEPADHRIDRTLEVLGKFGLNKLYLALWNKTLDGFSQVIQPQDFG